MQLFDGGLEDSLCVWHVPYMFVPVYVLVYVCECLVISVGELDYIVYMCLSSVIPPVSDHSLYTHS